MEKLNKKIDSVLKFDIKDMESIFLINKDTDPLTSFYEFIVVELNKEQDVLSGFRPICSKVVMNTDTYKKEVLNKIIPKYAKKQRKFFTKKAMELSIAMYDLDIGPNTSEDVPKNEIWVLKNWLELV